MSTALAALVGCTLLVSCALPSVPYVPPTGGATATITFVSTQEGVNLSVFRLKDEPVGCECSAAPMETVGIMFNKAVLVPGSGNYADKGKYTNTFSTTVPADGTSFRFMMPSVRYEARLPQVRTDYCQAHQSFVPRAGAKYVATFDYARDPCAFDVVQVEESVSKPVALRAYPMCAIVGDNLEPNVRRYCRDNAQFYRQSAAK
jgi:hypothetical protein